MTLLVDLGNSRIKWASSHGKTIKFPGSKKHVGQDLGVVLDLVWGKKKTPSHVYVANVAGESNQQLLVAWAEKNWHLSPTFIQSSAEQAGIRNQYVDPSRLGVDRWMAMIEAHRKVKGPCCIVDCGTAITIDAIDQEGQHLGGLIFPGLQTMRQSLIEGTAAIRDLSVPGVEASLLARDTEGAVIGGTLYAAIATIDRVMLDISAQVPGKMNYLITGGDAKLLLPLLHADFHYDQDLVLHGLNVVVNSLLGEKQ